MSYIADACSNFGKADSWISLGKNMLVGGVVSFVAVTYLSGGNLAAGSLSAVVSVICSIAHFVIGPFLKPLITLDDDKTMSYTTEWARRFVIVVIADQIIRGAMRKRIDLVASGLYSIGELIFKHMVFGSFNKQPELMEPASFGISSITLFKV